MLAGLARTKVLAVLLGPAGVGVASVIDQVVSLVAQLGSLSIPFVGLKFLARARDGGAEETRSIYDALVMLLVLASIVAAAIGTGIASAWPSFFGEGLAAIPIRLDGGTDGSARHSRSHRCFAMRWPRSNVTANRRSRRSWAPS